MRGSVKAKLLANICNCVPDILRGVYLALIDLRKIQMCDVISIEMIRL